MPSQPTHAAPQDPGQPAADPHGYRQVLHDLIEMGAGLARLLHGQATAQAAAAQPGATPQPQPAPAPDTLVALTVAFDRVARAVRRCVALARSLDAPAPPVPNPAHDRAAARKRIIRSVEDAIGRAANPDGDAAESLAAELRERLDAPDLDDDIGTRPVPEIIAEICRDLGLAAPPGTQPWKRRTPADIAQLCARAAAPSAARQPGAAQPFKRGATPSASPNPAVPGAKPPASDLPQDPAKAIIEILRQPTCIRDRWRPPPGA